MRRRVGATQWERAAIVYAFTYDTGGGRPKSDGIPSLLTIKDFAAEGIAWRSPSREQGSTALVKDLCHSAAVERKNPDPLNGLMGLKVFHRKAPGWGCYEFCDHDGRVLASLRTGKLNYFTDMAVGAWLYRIDYRLLGQTRLLRRPTETGGTWETVRKMGYVRDWELADGSRLDVNIQHHKGQVVMTATREGEHNVTYTYRINEDLPIAVLSPSAPDIELMLPLLLWAVQDLRGG